MNNIEQGMPIGANQLTELTRILEEYKAGKSKLDHRVISAENWWKLRNSSEEQQDSAIMNSSTFTSKSGWLHNVISSKHADAMEAYPEPNILPREKGDKGEANMLTSIVPCVLEQNHFESTYSDAMWSKMKSGTGIYKVVWNKNKMNGLGDIDITTPSILNLFWEPGIKDIQKSKYFFQTELVDKDLLVEMYPDLFPNGVKGDAFTASKFAYDDTVKTDNKATVIDCYYHKYVEGKNTLQYIKYVGDTVIYATENDIEPVMGTDGVAKPPMAVTGLYDHGKYPYVFDPLYPVEGSPCGYGFVDLCQNPQTEIDILKTSFVRNARFGAQPRYFSRMDGNVNEDEFLDLSKTIVHVTGNIDETAIRKIDVQSIDGSFMNLLEWDVNELRETSGNTETSTGSVPSGVTSGAAIAALQTASGKGSKDSTKASYRKYSEMIEIVIELIRQFYTLPRKFRILGKYGIEDYISYTSTGIQAQPQGNELGVDGGMRMPLFDIKVSAQTKNVYTKISQNELAIQFFQLGFCNPQMTDQALMCIGMMDFEGKDLIMQEIAKNGTMFDKLQQYMQLALILSQKAAPQYTQQIATDIQQLTGVVPQGVAASPEIFQSDNVQGAPKEEAPTVEKARMQAEQASQPV